MKLSAPWSRHVAEKRPAVPAAQMPPVPLMPPLPADSDLFTGFPVRYPAAFCAPGTEPVAAITLWLRGVHVADIRGSRMLEGRTDVIVVKEPPELLPSREAFRVEPVFAGPDRLWYRLASEMLLRAPVTFGLAGVVSPYRGEVIQDEPMACGPWVDATDASDQEA